MERTTFSAQADWYRDIAVAYERDANAPGISKRARALITAEAVQYRNLESSCRAQATRAGE